MQANELGVRSVILDGPDSWSRGLETEGLIKKFVPIDFAEADTVFERCLAAVNKVKKVRLTEPLFTHSTHTHGSQWHGVDDPVSPFRGKPLHCTGLPCNCHWLMTQSAF